jgi:chromosome partitioning protein
MGVSSPYVFVVGNVKGGAGKTTCAMHLIAGLLHHGLKVGSIDTDYNQLSLTNYIRNREITNARHPEFKLKMPVHSFLEGKDTTEEDARKQIGSLIADLKGKVDAIVIDTQGSFCAAAFAACSYADTLVTPINDSFLDIDLLAKVDADSFKVTKISSYSEIVWKQKLVRAQRDGGQIEWVILRNRLSNLDARNKRAVAAVVEELSRRVKCRVAVGFSERVIFKELFLQGITLLDIESFSEQSLTMSHIAARQELRNLFDFLGMSKIKDSARNSELPHAEHAAVTNT